jgi:L-amino acid N-acyltransferase YncA
MSAGGYGVALAICCLGAECRRWGTLRMEIFSDYANRRNKGILPGVFEVKEEIPADMFEPRTVKLKDGKDVLIRALQREDLERYLAFFLALSEEDRLSLRGDLTTREAIEERIREMEAGTVKRLVAVADETIVADGALELSHFGWERHIAEVRLIVATPYQHKGLGMLMAGALYDVAASTGIEEIVVKMMATQTAALRIFDKLGFRQEVVLRQYVKDMKGTKRDLVLMRCPLRDLWQRYEDFVHETDMRPFRMG